MIQNYNTGKLPANFIYLGVMLLGVSIWRMIVLDWMGIILFIISLFCLLTRSGVLIDPDQLRIKKYIGFLGIRTGAWENIESFVNLQVLKVKETQGMNVLSISRTEIRDVYKLLLVLPGKSIELMTGDKKFIFKKGNEISSLLKTMLLSLVLMLLSSTIFAQHGSIEVKINGIENNEGIVLIGLYNDGAKFPDFDKSYTGAAPKANKMGTTHTFTEIPAGTYAIAVWHDEDEDKTLDKNILGIPKENYGFSNNAFGTFGPPDFEDAAFEVISDEKKELVITLK